MVLNHGILDESDVADFVVYIGLGNSLHKLLHLLFILIFNLSLFFFSFSAAAILKQMLLKMYDIRELQ